MEIEVRAMGMPVTEGMRAHVERRLAFALDRFGNRVARVTVRVADVNGPRGGPDKACRVNAALRTGHRVHIDERDLDAYAAIDRAAHRLGHTVARRLER
ncbi:MAG: HPF/RaiA family ribosome-associated protein [Anaeromyxobacteraceae bacterium]